jgi:hypothetical protein
VQNATKLIKNVNKNATNLAINHVKRLKLVNKNVTNLVINLAINLVIKLKLVNKNVTSLAINLAKKHKIAKLKQNAIINTNINMKVATININQK